MNCCSALHNILNKLIVNVLSQIFSKINILLQFKDFVENLFS